MITMKSLKHGATALLLTAVFVAAGAYEAAAVPALYGTFGKGDYSTSTLAEIDRDTGQIIRIIGQVGYTVNGLAWDSTTHTLYGSTRAGMHSSVTSGEHDGGSGSTVLYDSSQNFIGEGVKVGMQVVNNTDGSWGIITALSATSITANLAWGSTNRWDNGDEYTVYKFAYNGLIRIDLATGAGTPIGVQGWGLEPVAAVTNIAVNSSGQMYGWSEQSDDLVSINKYTGVATVVGDSGVSTWANGLAFNNFDTLYLINGDGNYYYMNTVTGAATLQGDISPGAQKPAHHGVFDPVTNLYYGLRGNPWPSDTSSVSLLAIDMSSGSVQSMVPTAYDLHTLAFVDLPGLVLLKLDYDDEDSAIDMEFTIGTEVPALLVIRLEVFDQDDVLAKVALPKIDPRETVHVSVPFPSLGKVGVLTTLVTREGGIMQSAWETVDTGH